VEITIFNKLTSKRMGPEIHLPCFIEEDMEAHRVQCSKSYMIIGRAIVEPKYPKLHRSDFLIT
jgi:hypothetical protein